MTPRRFIITACAAALICAPNTHAYADAQSETVKAVMIRKFAEYVRWPEANSPQKEMQVRVCVYGDSPMSQMGAVFAKTSPANPIKFTLVPLSDLGAAGSCHIVFIGGGSGEAAARLAKLPVLTVSDVDGFANNGGMIGFEIIDGKVRYNINRQALSAADLKADAQLLAIANKVVE